MYKILLVEDEEMIRKGLAFNFDWMKSDCVVVAEATDGVDGIEKIKSCRPDIVVTDVGMPLKNGIEMLQETIEEYQYAAIILSVYDEFHYAKMAMHIGVCEYLLKPLEHEQLSKALEKAKEQWKIKRHYRDSVIRTEQVMNRSVLTEQLITPQNINSRRVLSMITYVEENYSRKISIDQMVGLLDTSATYLNQKFKEETGYTFNDFVNRYRIQQAIELLKTGNCKVYHVAGKTGFKEYKYFLHVFRKYTGVSPSQFIKYFSGPD